MEPSSPNQHVAPPEGGPAVTDDSVMDFLLSDFSVTDLLKTGLELPMPTSLTTSTTTIHEELQAETSESTRTSAQIVPSALSSGFVAPLPAESPVLQQQQQQPQQQHPPQSSIDDEDQRSPTLSAEISMGLSSDEKDSAVLEARWEKLITKYLFVFLLASFANWLQGPYVETLFSDYGISQSEITLMFAVGFVFALVVGPFVGLSADWGGRRLFVILYAVIYTTSCFTTHFKVFAVLVVGRCFSGIALGLLFTVFDAWLVRAHSDRGLSSFLGKSFVWITYLNSIVAVGAGLIARFATDYFPLTASGEQVFYIGGYLAPFDIAIVVLVTCAFLATFLWEENYGEEGRVDNAFGCCCCSREWLGGLWQAMRTACGNMDILLCGAVSSLFESTVYMFFLTWTPAITADRKEDVPYFWMLTFFMACCVAASIGYGIFRTGTSKCLWLGFFVFVIAADAAMVLVALERENDIPYGLIFCTFMVCSMTGSALFGCLDQLIRTEMVGVIVVSLAAFTMVGMALSSTQIKLFIFMNLFQMTVGMYWPTMGVLKASIVPEAHRATIYGFLRVPLNALIVASLLIDITPTIAFELSSGMLVVAGVLQLVLMVRRRSLTTTSSSPSRLDTDELVGLRTAGANII